MELEMINHTCPNCAEWFDIRAANIKTDLIDCNTRSSGIREVHYCPNHGNEKVELLCSASNGIQTPYEEAVCEIIKTEIRAVKAQLASLEERLITLNDGE